MSAMTDSGGPGAEGAKVDPRSLAVVVITAGGRPDLLDRCLDSVDRLAPEAERILVRQGPHESLPDRPGWLVVDDDGRGASRARNRGAAAASRPWLQFLDDDAELVSWWWRVGSSAPPWDEIDAVAMRMVDRHDGRALIPFPTGSGEVHRSGSWRRLIESAVVMRTETFRRVGGFDEAFGAGRWAASDEILDLVFRMFDVGARVWYVPIVAAYHPTPVLTDTAKKREYGRGTGWFVRRHWRHASALRYGVEAVFSPVVVPVRFGRDRSWWIGRWYRALGVLEGLVGRSE
jgi:GT2 family glycosyltransferase